MTGEELRDAVREVLREELPRLLADARHSGEPDLLDLPQAAHRLGLGKSTVRKLAASCELASVKVGRRVLFRSRDLDAYADERRRSPERVRDAVKDTLDP
jgi:excisionase family DNA binding protein